MKFFFLWIVTALSYEMLGCSHCKFLKRDIKDIHFGKCSRYPVKKAKYYHYTYSARLWSNLCGKDGKYYEPLGK